MPTSSLSSIFTQQWSELPKDLLDSITNLLNLDDLFRFSNVCKNMEISFIITTCSKSYNPSSTSQTDPTWNKTLRFFSLYNGKLYNVDVPQVINRRICGSCNGGWLITVHGNGEIQVLHPFSKVVIDLPPIAKLPNVISSYDMEKKEFVYTLPTKIGLKKVKMMTKIHYDFMRRAYVFEVNSDWMRRVYLYKVIMSCSDMNNGIVMALQGFSMKLAFCRIGKDHKWNIVNGDDNAIC